MRRLRHLTGHRRTVASNRVLGLLLAFNAGAVNAGGFLVVHLYTSHMTGFISMLADNLVLGNMALVLLALSLPPLWADRARLRHPLRQANATELPLDPPLDPPSMR